MDAIGPAAIVPPGHEVPHDMEPDSEEVVTGWLISMGPDIEYGTVTEEPVSTMAAHVQTPTTQLSLPARVMRDLSDSIRQRKAMRLSEHARTE